MDSHGGYLLVTCGDYEGFLFMSIYNKYCYECSHYAVSPVQYADYITGYYGALLEYFNIPDVNNVFIDNQSEASFYAYKNNMVAFLDFCENNGELPAGNGNNGDMNGNVSVDLNGSIALPEIDEDKIITFGYVSDLPEAVTLGDIYVIMVRGYNMFLLFIWVFIAFNLLEIVFINLNKLHHKGGG